MSLWMHWWNAIWRLRPAFSRLQTFLWFATAVAGFTVRTDMLGVTSIVRALNLDARCYNTLIDCFHSSAVKLDRLTALWTQVVLRLFPQPLRVNGRCVLVGDGIKVPKCGRKMPAVKLLHQQSESNTKPEYIMGHSLQAVSLLVQAASSFFAVPLAVRIHEGLVWSNRDRRTLLDKMLALLGIAAVEQPFYFVADAYYAAHKIVAGLLKQNNHLLTRMKSNAVAYTAYQQRGPRKRGRPRVYGRKIKLSSLLQASRDFQPTFTYHFWMSDMRPLRRNSGNQHLHRYLARVPQQRQAKASRLPRLYPDRHHLPGTASVPRRCPSPARLELFRLLASNYSPRHPALRARRCHRTTREPPRISPGYPPELHLREIRHRTTGHQQNAGLPPRRMIPKFLANLGLAS